MSTVSAQAAALRRSKQRGELSDLARQSSPDGSARHPPTLQESAPFYGADSYVDRPRAAISQTASTMPLRTAYIWS